MRPDGNPEPDDYGLPRVDVVVPDDARELDRDVIAYHREERRRRRSERLRRLARPFTRYGLAIPIITGAVLVALISGGLMTALGPRPAPRPTASVLAPHASATPGAVGGTLPMTDVTLDGRDPKTVSVLDARPGVIGIVRSKCGCEKAITELAARTGEFKLKLWIGGNRARGSATPSIKELRGLAGKAHGNVPQIFDDPRGVLSATYARPDAPITTIFVRPDGIVTEVTAPMPTGKALSDRLKALNG
ncbi:hypothetical protein [Spirillospora sp. CA-294931]|uniref:hypothetical protein n=1 Tax=Spirillospora sp. CA-294931 TaxID=3240042 RepID=UPI003D8CCDCD